MDQLFNPFSPGAGSPPPELAGRDELIEHARIALGRIKAGRHEQSLILVGLRGVGKTVLLNRIRQLAEGNDYGVAMIEATETRTLAQLLAPKLRKILFQYDTMAGVSDKVKRAMRIFRSFVSTINVRVDGVSYGIDIDPERGTADSGDLESDLTEFLISIGEAAQDRDASVAIFIDEIQYLSEEEMSSLIMAFHAISQRALPVILLGGGLPSLISLAGRAKSYAERLFIYPEVGPLLPKHAKAALQDPVSEQSVKFTDEALDEIIRVTQGYPYFLQEWGYQAWGLADQSPIGLEVILKSTKQSIEKLDQSFFRVRFDRLTPSEKNYMRAMAQLGSGPHRSGDVADCMGVRVQSVSPVRATLIRKGMIYSPAYGDTAFTVPLFDEFMKRAMPE